MAKDIDLMETGFIEFPNEAEAREFIKDRVEHFGITKVTVRPDMIESLLAGKTIIFDVAYGEFVGMLVPTAQEDTSKPSQTIRKA